MNYDDLRDLSLEDALNQVTDLGTVAHERQVQSVGALGARLTIEVADVVRDLSGTVFTAKKQLIQRLDHLTGEIQTAHQVVSKASDAASKQTAALVRWTRVLVFVTIAYTLITGGLLIVAIIRGR